MSEDDLSRLEFELSVGRAGLALTKETTEQLALGWQKAQPLLRRLRRTDGESLGEPVSVFYADPWFSPRPKGG